jgi:hypothetical protein
LHASSGRRDLFTILAVTGPTAQLGGQAFYRPEPAPFIQRYTPPFIAMAAHR